MKLKIKSKYFIVFFSLIIISSVILFLTNCSYSIVEIDADNYKAKLRNNRKSVWATGIENYIPRIDAECFSIRTREVYTLGQRYGVKILKCTNSNYISKYGTYYCFESAPSNLEYKALYKKRKDPGKIDMVIEIRIDSKWKDDNMLKIKEIIRKLCEENGFVLKRSRLILGSDIIIKETEDSFIIGVINSKYDDNSHGLVTIQVLIINNSYWKKIHFYG
jgi:uncharacterized protein YihD (DUF1040 family)